MEESFVFIDIKKVKEMIAIPIKMENVMERIFVDGIIRVFRHGVFCIFIFDAETAFKRLHQRIDRPCLAVIDMSANKYIHCETSFFYFSITQSIKKDPLFCKQVNVVILIRLFRGS